MSEVEIPIELDRQSPLSLAAQVAKQLRTAILEGLLQPDHTLPATRRLAAELGVSRGVVVRAFEQLSGEGFLEGSGAGGTKVAVRPDIQSRPLIEKRLSSGPPHSDLIDLTPGRPSASPSCTGSGAMRGKWRFRNKKPRFCHRPSGRKRCGKQWPNIWQCPEDSKWNRRALSSPAAPVMRCIWWSICCAARGIIPAS